MQLWTIQSAEVWQILQRNKVLRAKREHVIQSWDSDYNLPAYDWLRERMTERVGPPPEPDIYPMWAYFQFADAKHRCPDLRRVRSWHPRGKQMLLLELGVDENRVLLSDYYDWHYVLNDYYFGLSEAENIDFENADHPAEVARALKFESWLRCLDMDFHAPGYSSPRDEKTIQATIWELRVEDVVGVREFVGSGTPSRFSWS